jgi:hypothetical protein
MEAVMKRIIIIMIGVILTAILITLSVGAHKHRWYSNQSNTLGWEIMTSQEQREYHIKMQNLSSYDECSLYIAGHKGKMESRAKEKGVILPVIERSPCDIMKSRRMFRKGPPVGSQGK